MVLKDENDQSQPGPARLEIYRLTPEGFVKTRLEDGDSMYFTLFHLKMVFDH